MTPKGYSFIFAMEERKLHFLDLSFVKMKVSQKGKIVLPVREEANIPCQNYFF